MSALQKYINDSNKWLAIFGKEPKPFPTTRQELEYWYGQLENALSPENLYCDGELAPAKARAKAINLHAVQAELEALLYAEMAL